MCFQFVADVLKDLRGAVFSTFDTNNNNLNVTSTSGTIENVDCAVEKENSWWFGDTNNKCGGINANAYNYEDMNWDDEKIKSVQLDISAIVQSEWYKLRKYE